MKILLTGASGFIGKNIISHLFKKKIQLIIIISDSIEDLFFLNLKKKFNEKLLILNKKNFFKKRYEIDYIFFLSSPSNDTISTKAFDKNYKFLKKILDYLSDQKISKFVFLSSGGVYGTNKKKKLLQEMFKHKNKKSLYAQHKIRCEELLNDYHNQYFMNICILRVFSVFGPNMDFDKYFIGNIFKHILEKSDFKIFNPNLFYRNYIYIDDLIKIIFKSLKLNSKFSIINVGNFNIRNDILYKTLIKYFNHNKVKPKIFNDKVVDYNIPNLNKQKKFLKIIFTNKNVSFHRTYKWLKQNYNTVNSVEKKV